MNVCGNKCQEIHNPNHNKNSVNFPGRKSFFCDCRHILDNI